MLRRPVRSSIVVALALLMSFGIPVALAGSVSGNANCLTGKSVKISSTAKVEVWHLWTNHADYFNNPVSTPRTSLTGFEDTWWTISWSVSKTSHAVTCISVG